MYIQFVADSKIYECDFSLKLSLRENIQALLSMNSIKKELFQKIDETTLVFEKSTLQPCHMDMPLYTLNIWNEIDLIVY